jgi:hypothetical protein
LKTDGEVKKPVDPELAKKGKLLAEEIDEKKQSTLHRWMAHHLVERMEEADSDDEDRATAATRECADLIARLWDQKIKREVLEMQYRVREASFLASEDLDCQMISDARSGSVDLEELDLDSRHQLFYSLLTVEKWLLQILTIIRVMNATEEEAFDEVVTRFFTRERAGELVDRLAKVFPEFEDAEITEQETLRQRTESALHQVYQLRFALMHEFED